MKLKQLFEMNYPLAPRSKWWGDANYRILENTESFGDQMLARYPELESFSLFDWDDNTIKLQMIKVSEKKMGVGTNVMNDLIQYADRMNKRIVLVPGSRDDVHGTTSKARLIKFYKRFGFVENKGRHKDFAINHDMMYREPR